MGNNPWRIIMHENRKLWMKRSEIRSIFFSKRVFYFRHHENPTTLDSASLRLEFARPTGSDRIFMILGQAKTLMIAK